MSPLQGKVILVTGASSGLGAETARLLSRQGATIFGIGRDTGRLAEVFADVERGSYAPVECRFGAGVQGRGRTVRPGVRRAGRPD